MQKFVLFLIRLLLTVIGIFSPRRAAKTAAFFFERPPRRKNRTWMKEFLDTATNDYFEVDGHQIKSYLWKGAKPGVLFLHGWRSNAARWKYLIEQMQDLNVDLISVDAPGHGESKHPAFTPPNYAKVINPLIKKYQPKIVIAHSVGGFVALFHHAYFKPKGIKYVLMAPTYDVMLPITEMFKVLNLSMKTQKSYVEIVEENIGGDMTSIRADKLIENDPPEGILIHDVNDDILPYKDSIKLIESAPSLKYYQVESTGHRMQNDVVEEIIVNYVTEELKTKS